MKKVLIISIFLLSSIIYYNHLYADNLIIKEDYYFEKIHEIETDNLPSNKVNKVFKDLDIFMIEIEVEIRNVIKTYKVNTYLTGNIEKELTKSIVNELNDEGLRELSAVIMYKGFTIKKVKLLCSDYVYDLIKERIKN